MISSFVKSRQQLQVVRGTLTGGTSGRLGVLDASFNPPNSAHAELGRLLLQYDPGCQLVLLLSTGNADKPTAPLDQLEQRLQMVNLFASRWPDCCVALTSEPLFVGKSKALWAQCTSRQLFAMGMDTVLRLFDQKYYSEPVERALSPFLEHADILALTRAADEVSGTPQIEPIEHPNVFVQQSGAHTNQVSSSRARTAAAKGDTVELQRQVPAAVAEYIVEQGLYK